MSSNGFLSYVEDESLRCNPITIQVDIKHVCALMPLSSEGVEDMVWDEKEADQLFERWKKKFDSHDIETDNEPDYLDGRSQQSFYPSDSAPGDLGSQNDV